MFKSHVHIILLGMHTIYTLFITNLCVIPRQITSSLWAAHKGDISVKMPSDLLPVKAALQIYVRKGVLSDGINLCLRHVL